MLAGQFIVIEDRKPIVGHIFLARLLRACRIGVAIGEVAYHDRRCVFAMLCLVRSLVFLDGLGLSLPRLLSEDHHPRASLRALKKGLRRSEEHTSELQSLMRHSYADFWLKKKNIERTTEVNT